MWIRLKWCIWAYSNRRENNHKKDSKTSKVARVFKNKFKKLHCSHP